MTSDEREIRALVETWMKATRDGDAETVLGLMADDAKFIVAGQPPFGKEVFEAAAKHGAGASMEIDARSEILEINVVGDWASMLAHLTVSMKPAGQDAVRRAGNTLTVLTRRDGRWLLYRDANLLVPVEEASSDES